MSKNDLLKLKNRKIIYEYISENPGLHLRKVIKDISLSEGTIRYHLQYLIDKKLIIKYKKNGYNRFYASTPTFSKDKKFISYLRNENTRLIIIFYFFHVCGSLTKVCESINKDKKDVYNYIKKLLEDDILEVAPIKDSEASTNLKKCKLKRYPAVKGEKVYRLKEPYKLNEILFSLRNKYLDNGKSDELLEILYILYSEKNKRPETIQSDKEMITSLEDLFFELFPIPICA